MNIDEFSFQPRVFQYDGWAKKNSKPTITCSLEQSIFSFVVALSNKRFYGVIGVKGTIDSKKFIHYLVNLVSEVNKRNKLGCSNFIFIADNAAIHKSSEVKKILEKNRLSLLTIFPYSPWQNPVESYISSIKAKIKKNWSNIK